jgi:hypothetical protein
MKHNLINIRAKVLIPFLFLFLALGSCQNSDHEDLLIVREKYEKLQAILSETREDVKKYKQLFEECQSPQSEKTEAPASKRISTEQEIGVWTTPSLYGGGRLRLFKKDNGYFKTETFPDGSSSTHKMSMSTQGGNKVFKSLERASSDKWVVTQGGKLNVIDKDGLIYSVDSGSSSISRPNSSSSYSNQSNSSDNQSKIYTIVNSSYGFANSESGLKRLLEAARNNDTQKINQMIIDGDVKTFPAGTKIDLVKQGYSTIVIKDPASGRNYYGVTESIR